jgi:hypothetical protein
VLLACCACAFAQEATLAFSGATLRIGMKKTDVLAALAEHSDLKKLAGSGDTWCAKPKDEQSPEPCPCQMSFLDGNLTVVNKRHGKVVGDDAAKLVSAFFSRLKEVQDSGKKMIEFRTEEFSRQDERIRGVVFEVDNTTFTLTTTQVVGDSPYTSVVYFTETMRLPSAKAPVK